MGSNLQSDSGKSQSVKGQDSFDLYDPKSIQKRWDGYAAFLETSATEAESGVEGATRWIMACLFKTADWRTRFPRALTDGADGGFARALMEKATAKAHTHLKTAFDQAPGAAILDFCVTAPHLHVELPSALLPGAQKRFVRWLFDHGRQEEGFLEIDILGFLQLGAENRAGFTATAYLLQPQWQTQFPDALTAKGAPAFLSWLQDEFKPLAPALSPREFPPEMTSRVRAFNGAGRLSERAPFNWQPPRTGLGQWLRRRKSTGTGVNVLGPMCFAGGVGQAARITAASLQAAGAEVSCRDTPGGPPETPRCEYLGPETHATTLIHSLPDAPLETLYRHVGWPLIPPKRRIAIWYWELEDMPSVWTERLDGIDEIWAPTAFIAEAARRLVSLPVVEMPPAVRRPETGGWSRAQLGMPEQGFVFLFMFDMLSTFQRKNPLAVIEAFRQAATKDARLVIKVSHGHFNPGSLAILHREADRCGALILDEVMSREKSLALIARCDCYVSLHRSEGFGLPLAEAMLLGKPVIGTRYSGNLDFMTDDNSLLVDYERVPVGPGVRIYPADYHWAEPSVEHAAARMRWVLENREAAAAMGSRAKQDTGARMDSKAYGIRMLRRIEEGRQAS